MRLPPSHQSSTASLIKAVFWDFGGVLSTSPFEAFNAFEHAHGLPANFIRNVNARNSDANAWAQLERNAITIAEFEQAFAAESQTAGHSVAGRSVLELLYGELRPAMIDAVSRCKPYFLTACLTNNIAIPDTPAYQGLRQRAQKFVQIYPLFHLVLESSQIGIRKPDPRFFAIACERLAVSPQQVVYLDDLGINLKPARTLGMTTIKVTDPEDALRQLEWILNRDLH